MLSSKLSVNKLNKLNYNGVVKTDYDLKDLTTYRIGGKAKYYLEINTLENFIQVMLYLEELNTEFFVIGNGSNLLVSDKGYNGVVIKLAGDFARCEQSDDTIIECGAGVSLGKAYAFARELHLSGLEDSAGIPASIGGAVTMNASAYSFEIAKIVDYVIVWIDGKINYYSNEDCEFSYRESIFQHKKCIILRVGLKLNSLDKETIHNRYLEVLSQRVESQPISQPSAGCVFRKINNYQVSKMLDELGLKGRRVGGAVVSTKHANFIINDNNAKAQDIYELIKVIKNEFKLKYGLELMCEIKFVGEFDETDR